MILHCGNVRTRAEATPAELAWLDSYLAVPSPGAEYSEAFQAKRWDGKDHLLNKRTQSFPTGLVRPILNQAARDGVDVALLDERERPQAAFEPGRAPWLRPYQSEALAAFLRRTRGILRMPTGSGKTEVFCALGAGFPTLRTLVLVDTRELLHQAADRYEARTGEQAGRVGDGVWESVGRNFVVATLQTLHSQLKEPGTQRLLDSARVLVVDEVQVLPAKTYEAVANTCVNAYWRLGTSATPVGRSDSRDYLAVGVTGPICHEVRRQDLVDAGVVASSRVVFASLIHPRTTGSYAAVYDALVAREGPRNDLVLELVRRAPRPTLVFVRLIQHGQYLERAIGREARTEFVHGATESRAPALERLQRGDIDVLVCSKIFNKGIDIPLAASAVNAAAGESSIDALQRLGRLSRVAAGKTSFTFFDVYDDGPAGPLRKHARSRVEAYRGDGHEVEILNPGDLPRVIASGPR